MGATESDMPWKVGLSFNHNFQKFVLSSVGFVYYVLTLRPRGAGEDWPIGYFSRAECQKVIHIFRTECQIELKPGCKFKFFRCLEVYKQVRDA